MRGVTWRLQSIACIDHISRQHWIWRHARPTGRRPRRSLGALWTCISSTPHVSDGEILRLRFWLTFGVRFSTLLRVNGTKFRVAPEPAVNGGTSFVGLVVSVLPLVHHWASLAFHTYCVAFFPPLFSYCLETLEPCINFHFC